MQKFTDVQGTANARMNLDASPEVIPNGMMREIMHMVDDGRGQLVNMKGFENVMTMEVNAGFTMPTGTFKCVGTAKDIENSQIIYFLCDTVGTAHSILSMNTDTKVLEWVLNDEPLLALRPDWRVDADVIEGLLSWTFGYFGSFLNNDFNPPRKINIAKAKKYTEAKDGRWEFTQVQEAWHATGIKAWEGMTTYIGMVPYPYTGTESLVAWSVDGINRVKTTSGYGTIWDMRIIGGAYYVTTDRPWSDEINGPIDRPGHTLVYDTGMYFGIDWQLMDMVKYPPAFAPTASFESDPSAHYNHVNNDMFQFCYRWVYDDNEKSVWSPKSEIPLPSVLYMLNGAFAEDQTIDNNIVVWVDTGSLEVTSIELAVRKGNDGAWSIINRKEKYDQDGNLILNSDIYNPYSFYNTETFEAVDQSDASRPFDFVPLLSNHQELIEKNRIVYGDITDGYDNIDIDVSLSNTTSTPVLGEIGGTLTEWTKPGDILPGHIRPTTPGGYFFWGGEIDFNGFYEDGFTYVIDFEGFPAKYDNPESITIEPGVFDPNTIYGGYAYKNIEASVVVNADAGMTFEDFADTVVAKLRNGNFADSCVIAVNRYNYKGFGLFPAFLCANTTTLNFPSTNNRIGFIIEYTTETPPSCVNCANINVRVTKMSNFGIEKTFTSGAIHPFGLFYMDRASRFGAVNKSPESQIYIPSQVEGENKHELLRNSISWKIDHIPPVWATHYAWGYAKNVSVEYDLYATISKLAVINDTDSLFIGINKYVIQQNESIKKFAVPAYKWEYGDRIRFILNNNTKTFQTLPYNLDFEIIGTLDAPSDFSEDTYEKNDLDEYVKDAGGNKIKDFRQTGILIESFNYRFYGIEVDNTVVEIYRPMKKSDSVVYYQFEQVLPIINPHTNSRAHGGGYDGTDQTVTNDSSITPATGTFRGGDAYLRYRIMVNAFPCETSRYSDYYASDALSIGTPNMVNVNMRNHRFPSNLRYGGRLIQDTRVNDMSRFLASDTVELKDKYGAVYSLEEVGDVLKVHQKSKVSSLLIGRAGVTQPNEEGTQIISSTKDVLGTLVVPSSNYGTVHSGSVVASPTRNYFFDFYAHSLIRDAGNGHQNLTELYGLKQFMASMCRQWGTPENVSVIGGWDQENSLVWWTFDSDTASFSLAFRDNGGVNEDGFACFGMFIPDQYGMSKYTATAFKDNALWLMNSDNVPRCNFFGEQFTYWLTPVFNKGPVTMKRWLQIMLSTAKKFAAPNAGDVEVPISGNSPAGMVSLLKSAAFTPVNGKMVADFGKNMTTNSLTPTNADLVNGDDLTGQCLVVRLEGSETTQHGIFAVEVNGIA